MATYTFYPCASKGLAETFVASELPDDDEARIHAYCVLDRHPEASHVVVWSGERRVYTRSRVHPDLAALLGSGLYGETRRGNRPPPR